MDSILELISSLSAWQVHLAIFGLIVASGLGLFSEDLAVITAGLLAYQGVVHPVSAVVVCLVAVLLADSILFGLGAALGEGALKRPWLHRLVGGAKFDRARDLARRKGAGLVPLIRFLLGLRAPLFIACGTLGIGFRRFVLFDGLAAAVELTALVCLAYWAGSSIDWLTAVLSGLEQVVLLTAAGLLAVLLTWLILRRTRQARRTQPEQGQVAVN